MAALSALSTLDDDQLVGVDTIAQLARVSEGTVWRWVRLRQFPAPIRLSLRCSRWKMGVVRQYLQSIAPQVPA